jgi:hypothetical protein
MPPYGDAVEVLAFVEVAPVSVDVELAFGSVLQTGSGGTVSGGHDWTVGSHTSGMLCLLRFACPGSAL